MGRYLFELCAGVNRLSDETAIPQALKLDRHIFNSNLA